jgi:hypothetical protein
MLDEDRQRLKELMARLREESGGQRQLSRGGVTFVGPNGLE